MTNEQKLTAAAEFISEVWNDFVPDRPPKTMAEEYFFEEVDFTAKRIISDIERMCDFSS